MTALPPIDPGFAAEVVDALPSRLAKKLGNADPASWDITDDGGVTRVVVGSATVTVSGPTEASCDCLLAPRCLHLAQVVSQAPVADAEPAEDAATEGGAAGTGAGGPASAGSEAGAASSKGSEAGTGASPTPDKPGSASSGKRLTPAQQRCVARAHEAITHILEQGLTVLTSPVRAEILRVVSLARSAGLHRLGATFASLHTAAATPTQRSVTQLRNAALAVQMLEHGDETGSLDEAAIGTARRVYRDVGVLRLRGLVAEPVLTDSGYAGAVAHFMEEGTKELWTVSAVAPGGLAEVRGAYRGSIGLGQLAAPLGDAVRSGVLLSPGTGSADRRLGRGKTVRASTRTPSSEPWPSLPDWWMGTVRLDGMVDADPYPLLRLAPVTDTPPPVVGLSSVAWQLDPSAFSLLVRLAGEQVRVILRADGEAWTLLAIDSDEWVLDSRPLFPGLDRLRSGATGSREVEWELPETDEDFAPAALSPEGVLARWSAQVALRGRRAITGAESRLTRDQQWLTEHASPHRAGALGRLADAARAGSRDFAGSFIADPSGLRTAWLAVALS